MLLKEAYLKYKDTVRLKIEWKECHANSDQKKDHY